METQVDADMGDMDCLQIDAQGKQKAAKHDDAEVPIYLWNDRVRTGSQLNLSDAELNCVQTCALGYWKRLVARTLAKQS